MAVDFLGSKALQKEPQMAKMSQETKDKIDEKVNNLKEVPDTFTKAGDAINDTLGAVNDTLKGTTEKVGAISITGAGLIATLKKPFVGAINWMKEPLRDETGEVVKEVLKDGKEIIKKSDKFCRNKVIGVAVAAGVAVVAAITAAVVKHVKAKKAEKAEQAQTGTKLDVTSTDEDSDK